jgi:hypothetical protein
MINGYEKNKGFIALNRSIQEHWIWEDPVKLQWWLDILLTVNHSDAKVNIGFDLMDCKRGQTLKSLQTWGKRWRVDVSTVRRFLKLLEIDKMIVTENEIKTTRLTVCNYDSYNTPRQAKQSQDNSEATPKQSQDNTNNNDSNKKSNNEEQLNISFDEFYNLYDKKRGREKSFRLWRALNDDERKKAMEHIPDYKLSNPDKQFRKDPKTYLSEKAFNDEIIKNGNHRSSNQLSIVSAGDRSKP